jgi:alpha-tubulin suppressor-like RCC1 family protein
MTNAVTRTLAASLAAVLVSSSMPSATLADDYVFRGRAAVIGGGVPGAGTGATALSASVPNSATLFPGGSAAPFSATGGTAPYAWSAAGLPSGVSIDGAGTLSATTQAAIGATAAVTATVTDAAGSKASATFALDVQVRQGTLMASGTNSYGHVLPSTTTSQPNLVAVSSAEDWTYVRGGDSAACGIRGGGDLYCWGNNGYGRLGIGNTTNVTTGPRLVSSGGWTAVSSPLSYHTCGIRNGTAHCWGYGNFGELGVGDRTGRYAPAPVGGGSGTTGWTAVETNGDYACGIRDGIALCWGKNDYGYLGNGTEALAASPIAVGGGSGTAGWTEIAVGYWHSCGIRGGKLLCWGLNTSGVLGMGDKATRTLPVEVDGGSTGWSGVTSGQFFTCALKDSKAYCWGGNSKGAKGTGGPDFELVPTPVGGGAGTTGWTSIKAGKTHTCGMRNGDLYCWGENLTGETGPDVGTNKPLPVRFGGNAPVKLYALGAFTTYVVR